ncbi:MAG TPA: hypothetical protein VM142_12725 [Acidimicrobiales bacterium]|nr:hypothetical protein [Acidimicrobiales bacterium]
MIVLDDHLVRDLAAGELPSVLVPLQDELATTNLWLFRLVGALARQGLGGPLSRHVKGLGPDEVARFRRELTERIEEITVVPMQHLVWSMGDLQQRHREAGRLLGTAMAEALAAAHFLGADIAVASDDVGPGLQAAAEADGITFHVIER